MTISPKLIKLLGVVTGAQFLLVVATMIITYPTQAHKDMYKTMTASIMNAEGSAQSFDALNRTPEAAYINTASAITLLVGFVLGLMIFYYTYRTIRRNRLASEAVMPTAIISTISSLIVSALSYGLSWAYLGTTGLSSGSTFYFGLVFSAVFAFLVSFVIAMIMEAYYNRKHSFEIS